jgi:hypothetical protein
MKSALCVAILIGLSQRSDRRMIQGVIAYAREHANCDP